MYFISDNSDRSSFSDYYRISYVQKNQLQKHIFMWYKYLCHTQSIQPVCGSGNIFFFLVIIFQIDFSLLIRIEKNIYLS